MATIAELQRAYNNPNVRKMLDLIASVEGVKHGYNTLFGNQQFSDLSQHPNVRKQFKQTDGRTNFTTAAGRYQFIKDTWAGLKQQYGFKDFSPQSQDLGAIALIAGRGALDDVMMGRFGKAIGKLGKEWAALPSSRYAQPKRSWGEVNKLLGEFSDLPMRKPQFEITSVNDTARLKGGVLAESPNQYDAFATEITSAQDTFRLKGIR